MESELCTRQGGHFVDTESRLIIVVASLELKREESGLAPSRVLLKLLVKTKSVALIPRNEYSQVYHLSDGVLLRLIGFPLSHHLIIILHHLDDDRVISSRRREITPSSAIQMRSDVSAACMQESRRCTVPDGTPYPLYIAVYSSRGLRHSQA